MIANSEPSCASAILETRWDNSIYPKQNKLKSNIIHVGKADGKCPCTSFIVYFLILLSVTNMESPPTSLPLRSILVCVTMGMEQFLMVESDYDLKPFIHNSMSYDVCNPLCSAHFICIRKI